MNALSNANTIEDVIRLIHPHVLQQIPENILNEIAQNILAYEMGQRKEILWRPIDQTVSRTYDSISDKITQIDYQGVCYSFNQIL